MSKSGRNRDGIWKHVDPHPTKHKYYNCKYCNCDPLYGQVRTIRNHLAHCSKVDDENKKLIIAMIKEAHERKSTQKINKRKSASVESSILGKRLLDEFEQLNAEQKEEANNLEPASKKRKLKQQSINEYKSSYYHVMNEAQQKLALLLLLELIIRAPLPLSIVDNKYFIRFVKYLNGSFELPTRQILTDKELPAFHEKVMKQVESVLKSWRSVSIGLDGMFYFFLDEPTSHR